MQVNCVIMKRTVFTILMMVFVVCAMAQPVHNKAIIGFYNVENLFDTIDDPNKNDEQFLPEGDYRWGSTRYNAKLAALSKVISQIAQLDGGLVVLGVSEIENEKVLQDLVATELLKPYASTQMNEVRTQINAKALIEKPFTGKKIHWSTRLTTQRFFEAEVAILEALDIRYEIVEPIEWERDMFTGKFLKLTSEQASLAYGNELYPQLTQEKATDRDGICMAYYLKNARQFGKK